MLLRQRASFDHAKPEMFLSNLESGLIPFSTAIVSIQCGRHTAMGKTGASIIFLNDTRQVLLLLRDNNKAIPFPNCWDLPGGHVEAGETPFECIRREMREELEMELEHPRLFR